MPGYKLAFLAAFLLHSQLSAAFSVTHNDRTRLTSTLAAATADDSFKEQHPNRKVEFGDLEPIAESLARQARAKNDEKNRRSFVKYGEELWSLRKDMHSLSKKLVLAINSGVREKEEEIRVKLREAENRDPELVYKVEVAKLLKATDEGRSSNAERHGRKAMAARSCLPQYNLEGLWVGKYGHHGYEMINITYAGDTLIAYKVTGDKNVPRGEITFQVDLNALPKRVFGSGSSSQSAAEPPLPPIGLTDRAAKKWGTTELPRYKGLGQVAEPGFTNNQWMDGQLIMISDEYFSFAWVPIEQQIFFGRPSPELALKMLRESSAASAVGARVWKSPPTLDDDVQVLKDYVTSCLEKTAETVEDDLQGDEFSCIWHGMDAETCCFQ